MVLFYLLIFSKKFYCCLFSLPSVPFLKIVYFNAKKNYDYGGTTLLEEVLGTFAFNLLFLFSILLFWDDYIIYLVDCKTYRFCSML